MAYCQSGKIIISLRGKTSFGYKKCSLMLAPQSKKIKLKHWDAIYQSLQYKIEK